MTCRTAALGGHIDRCTGCGYERPSYNMAVAGHGVVDEVHGAARVQTCRRAERSEGPVNSCRNRHCPKCQALAQHRWLEARRQRLLPVHHFHVVFTLPAELRALVRSNRRRMCDVLFRAAADTLLELGRDPRWIGGQLGLTAVLHTWSRDLSWHPHVHCVVTGGGLDDDGLWRTTREGFLFPVRVLGRLFRGKYLDAVRRLHAQGHLELYGPTEPLRDALAMDDLLDGLYRKDWVVYCKAPFGDVDAVYAYLGRFALRIGLSNRRLLHVDEDRVTFRTRHGKQTSLTPRLFLRRLLCHVLPPGYVRIRHYGLLASTHVHGRLELARDRLLARTSSPTAPVASVDVDPDVDPVIEMVRRLTGVDLRRCPRCRELTMQLRAQPLPNERAPPVAA